MCRSMKPLRLHINTNFHTSDNKRNSHQNAPAKTRSPPLPSFAFVLGNRGAPPWRKYQGKYLGTGFVLRSSKCSRTSTKSRRARFKSPPGSARLCTSRVVYRSIAAFTGALFFLGHFEARSFRKESLRKSLRGILVACA